MKRSKKKESQLMLMVSPLVTQDFHIIEFEGQTWEVDVFKCDANIINIKN